jgi:phosphatidylinositol-3-phosphatase
VRHHVGCSHARARLWRRVPVMLFAVLAVAALPAGSAGAVRDSAGPRPDHRAPRVTVTAPSSGETISGTTALEASASDRVGVTAVTWFVDDSQVAQSTAGAPWSASWDARTVANGTHTVYAQASDAAGNVGTSPDVTFTVDNTPASGGPCGTSSTPPTTYRHVIWILMENRSYSEIVGSSSAPFINQLIGQCGLATNFSAITHPSLPNYIALTSGDTWGIADDNPPSSHPLSVPSIYSQVKAAGGTWRDYEESAPGNCPKADSGTYSVHHDPAPYYTTISSDCANWDVPMGTTSSGNFLNDLNANTLPTFAFVTPNQCNNMHDCSITTGDAWLQSWVPKIIASPGYQAGGTALFITWDEDDLSANNHIATLIVSPSTPAGATSGVAFTHYSLLRTTEEMLGLPSYLGNAASATSMRTAFHL